MSEEESIINEEPNPSPTPTQTPWWVSDGQSMAATFAPIAPLKRVVQVTWYMALAMSLIAGLVGALIGKVAFDNSHHLVTSTSIISRAPNSVAGIAARVLPSVVEVDSSTTAGTDTGTGFFIESSGYIMTNNHVVEPEWNPNAEDRIQLFPSLALLEAPPPAGAQPLLQVTP